MTTTAAPQNDRLRQIAILVSSVDAATARNLMLHLPTQTAKQVRAMASSLGSVSEEEKRRILSEFKRSAATTSSSAPVGTKAVSPTNTLDQPPRATYGNRPNVATPSSEHDYLPEQDTTTERPAWTRLGIPAILRFVRCERPAIVAAVVSQLEPSMAVQVLQELPASVNREVLRRIAKLGEVDKDAMAAIDSYLSEQLQEYVKTARDEEASQRRINALLAAAPTALREHWQSLLSPDSSTGANTTHSTSVSQITVASQNTTQTPDASTDEEPAPAELAARQVRDQVQFGRSEGDSARILPFPTVADTYSRTTNYEHQSTPKSPEVAPAQQTADDVDRSLIQLEFERILRLDSSTLAEVLSTPPADTVLLALAGSTPEFMGKFYKMLLPEDARTLRNRLKSLSSLRLSDIDEAQQQILQLAIQAERQRSNRRRQAA